MSVKIVLAGLSSQGSGWARNAHLPYLLSERGRQRFTIVALLNSSQEAARAAIAHYGLPAATTRAYGDAAALAADIGDGKVDVNLVVVATRVDLHYPVVQPVLQAVARAQARRTAPTGGAPGGETRETPRETPLSVLVEWPLGSNLREVRELAALAADNAAHVRTAVALQGRLAPPYLAVRDLIASGRLGRLLSSEARAFGGSISRGTLSEGLAYFLDRSVGGNITTISLGHLVDSIQNAIGELTDTKSQMQLQRPDVGLVRTDADGRRTVVRTARSDVPDLITVVGRLAPVASPGVPAAARAAYFSDGSATLQVRLRRGEPFPGEPAFVWTVAGEKGEVRLTAAGGPSTVGAGGDVTVELHDFATDQVVDVPWRWADWQRPLEGSSAPGRNIGALYEAVADGREAEYATFADAQARHEQLARWLAEFTGEADE